LWRLLCSAKRRDLLVLLAAASVAPDVDYLTRLWGADVFLRYHRGLTHGVLALFAAPLLIALLWGLRRGEFLRYFFLTLLAWGLHLGLDLVNPYGTRLLSPLYWEALSLDWVFILDPYILLAFLTAFLWPGLFRGRARRAAALAFLFVFAYVGARAWLHQEALEFLQGRVDAYRYKLSPLPNDFLRWWFVADEGHRYSVGFVDLLSRRLCIQGHYDKGLPPLAEASKGHRVVKNFLYFAKYPGVRVKRQEDGTTVVVWKELSYGFLPGERFEARLWLGPQGRVLRAQFKF